MAAKDPMLAALGVYLRSVREKRGLSQEGLAFECGLHRTYIGAVERGEYNLTLLTLRRITQTLGITIVDAARGMTVKVSPRSAAISMRPKRSRVVK
jgi:transcriptional regulator with XRE-family HTH domain